MINTRAPCLGPSRITYTNPDHIATFFVSTPSPLVRQAEAGQESRLLRLTETVEFDGDRRHGKFHHAKFPGRLGSQGDFNPAGPGCDVRLVAPARNGRAVHRPRQQPEEVLVGDAHFPGQAGPRDGGVVHE